MTSKKRVADDQIETNYKKIKHAGYTYDSYTKKLKKNGYFWITSEYEFDLMKYPLISKVKVKKDDKILESELWKFLPYDENKIIDYYNECKIKASEKNIGIKTTLENFIIECRQTTHLSYTKVNVFRLDDHNTRADGVRFSDILSGHAKLETTQEKDARYKATSVKHKGKALLLEYEHNTIKRMNELTGIDMITLQECRFFDFAMKKEENLYAYAQVTVIKFDEEKGAENTGKTISAIKKYLKSGGCFITIVMLKDKLHSFYFLTPSDIDIFKGQNEKKEFRPSPFPKIKRMEGSLTEIMSNHYYPIDKLKDILEEFLVNAPTHTLKFLNEDKSMMGVTNYKEQQYFTKLEESIGTEILDYQQFKQGDVFIDGVLVEFKLASVHRKGYSANFTRPGHEQFNVNEIHCFATVLPGNDLVILWPTRTRCGTNAMGKVRSTFGFYYDHATNKVNAFNHQHLDPSSAFVFEFNKTTREDMFIVLNEFKNRAFV